MRASLFGFWAAPAVLGEGFVGVSNRTESDVNATCTLARRLVLLLSLVAVLAVVAGAATAEGTPVLASGGNDGALVVAGPPSALSGRLAPGGALPDDRTTPVGHPGPVLDTLLLAPPSTPVTGPVGAGVDCSATAGLDPGHGSPADPRGPPTV